MIFIVRCAVAAAPWASAWPRRSQDSAKAVASKLPFDRIRSASIRTTGLSPEEASSISVACRKRPVDPERVERVVNGIVRRLESSGESEIPSTQIGELVMDALRALDPVAYVRFASVYRNFREARDFEEFISDLAETNYKD